MIDRTFILAGQSIFTIEPSPEYILAHSKSRPLPGGKIIPKCKPHYTYRIRKPDKADSTSNYFIDLLIGPQNEADYKYLAMLITATGSIFAGRNYPTTKETYGFRILARVLAAIWEGKTDKIIEAGWNVHHVGKCGRCGRTLTTPESVESGIGPECRKNVSAFNQAGMAAARVLYGRKQGVSVLPPMTSEERKLIT